MEDHRIPHLLSVDVLILWRNHRAIATQMSAQAAGRGRLFALMELLWQVRFNAACLRSQRCPHCCVNWEEEALHGTGI